MLRTVFYLIYVHLPLIYRIFIFEYDSLYLNKVIAYNVKEILYNRKCFKIPIGDHLMFQFLFLR